MWGVRVLCEGVRACCLKRWTKPFSRVPFIWSSMYHYACATSNGSSIHSSDMLHVDKLFI